MTHGNSTYTPELGDIYALCDPDTGEVRYIGKAKNTKRRFAQHMRERRRDYPLYRWIEKLRSEGKTPIVKILEAATDWREAEKRLIAQYQGKRLLNVAAGGDEPYCPKEIRQENGRRNAIERVSTPFKAEIYKLKRELGLDLKQGFCSDYAKANMRRAAKEMPQWFGEWANV